jgi:hypothetical protein
MDNLSWKWMEWMGKGEGFGVEVLEGSGGWFSKSCFSLFKVSQHLACLKLSEIRKKIIIFAEFY